MIIFRSKYQQRFDYSDLLFSKFFPDCLKKPEFNVSVTMLSESGESESFLSSFQVFKKNHFLSFSEWFVKLILFTVSSDCLYLLRFKNCLSNRFRSEFQVIFFHFFFRIVCKTNFVCHYKLVFLNFFLFRIVGQINIVFLKNSFQGIFLTF